ncbi:toll/interleukin-1 receptor domain-containing protein [Xanthomarina gelatinilytica]|uniref:toll/interleukin-1 receptor domain-containing protein n=1 Tax=Xanthomarina gelatinilytica TaxID=1137281 RepID=UPI003AA83A0B
MALNRYYSSTKYDSRSKIISLGIKCIFISHQQKDKDAAKKIADYLINAGIDVYFDAYDGDLKINHQANNPKAVTDSIKKGINNSSHMLVLVSPNTLYSTWVPFEVGYGYDKTALYVLCLKGIKKGGLPEYIRAAKIIRDIWDINSFISNVTNKKEELLFESKKMFSHREVNNPLHCVMDSLINENY